MKPLSLFLQDLLRVGAWIPFYALYRVAAKLPASAREAASRWMLSVCRDALPLAARLHPNGATVALLTIEGEAGEGKLWHEGSSKNLLALCAKVEEMKASAQLQADLLAEIEHSKVAEDPLPPQVLAEIAALTAANPPSNR